MLHEVARGLQRPGMRAFPRLYSLMYNFLFLVYCKLLFKATYSYSSVSCMLCANTNVTPSARRESISQALIWPLSFQSISQERKLKQSNSKQAVKISSSSECSFVWQLIWISPVSMFSHLWFFFKHYRAFRSYYGSCEHFKACPTTNNIGRPDVVCVNNMDKMGWAVETNSPKAKI